MSNYTESMRESFEEAMRQLCRRDEEEKQYWYSLGPGSETWKKHNRDRKELKEMMK